MSEKSSGHDIELDLFDILEILWTGRKRILAFTSVIFLCGCIFVLSKPAKYESELIYSVNTLPPLYSPEKITTEFRNRFHDATFFKEWKKINPNYPINFADFSETIVFEGVMLANDERHRIAIFKVREAANGSIVLKTNQLAPLDGFSNYSRYVNEKLTKIHLVRAKVELKYIEQRIEDKTADEDLIKVLLRTIRFIEDTSNDALLLAIDHPTKPQDVSTWWLFVLVIFTVLGLILGSLDVLLRHAIQNRKQMLVGD